MELKSFYKYLIEKYWKEYGKEITRCDFSDSTKTLIRNEIDQYLLENNLYNYYSIPMYENDTDDYVKLVSFNEIKKLFSEELNKQRILLKNPKRFEHKYES